MISVILIMVFGILQHVNCAPAASGEEPQVVQELLEVTNETELLVNMSDAMKSQYYCTGKLDGVYPDITTCNRYYKCSQGLPQLFQCANGFEFNLDSMKCEERSNADCEDRRRSTAACQVSGNGIYPNYTSSCHEYYRCENGTVTDTFHCDPGFSFSVFLQGCLPSNEVPCVDISCSQMTKGYFVMPGTKCQGYYSCSNGTHLYGSCPDDMVFDVRRQICTPETTTCYEPICTGRVNGIYADTSHECRRAFKCFGGSLSAIITCPNSHIHNGDTCVPSYASVCQSPESTAVAVSIMHTDICNGLADGSYPSLDSECRGYFLCRGGRYLTMLHCAPGLRFDGRRCVQRNDFPCLPDCSHRPNGIYVDPGSRCRNYYYCLEGEIVAQKTCPEGTVHNGRMCVPSELTDCPSVEEHKDQCKGLLDGYHIDFNSNCKNYFICFGGVMKQNTHCEDNMVWNGVECIKNDTYICKRPKPWVGCVARQRGMYQDLSSSSLCRHYFYCYGGNRIDFTCPDGQLFDGLSCVSSQSYSCPKEESNSCFEKQDGYYQDPESGCRSYFYCSNTHKITYVCPHSYVFNGSKCVEATSYKCPYLSKDCTNKTNGYHYDKGSKCRKYFYCLEGEKIIILTCAKNKLFDGRNCVEANEFQCPEHQVSEECKMKPDGKYADTNLECKQYFQCTEGRKVLTFNCSEGKIFDGASCVSSNSHFNCQSLTYKKPVHNIDCSNKANGFYQNFTSGCQSYFYCIDGIKTTLYCPANEVFNGQLCVDPKFYTCPSYPMLTFNSTEVTSTINCQKYSIFYVIFFPLFVSS